MRCSPLVSASTLSEAWPHQCAGFCAWVGLPADKQGGITDLQTTAEHGHYLAPFARILLAIAYVREKDKPRAIAIADRAARRVSRAIRYFLEKLPTCRLRTNERASSSLSTETHIPLLGHFIRNSPVCNHPVTLRR